MLSFFPLSPPISKSKNITNIQRRKHKKQNFLLLEEWALQSRQSPGVNNFLFSSPPIWKPGSQRVIPAPESPTRQMPAAHPSQGSRGNNTPYKRTRLHVVPCSLRSTQSLFLTVMHKLAWGSDYREDTGNQLQVALVKNGHLTRFLCTEPATPWATAAPEHHGSPALPGTVGISHAPCQGTQRGLGGISWVTSQRQVQVRGNGLPSWAPKGESAHQNLVLEGRQNWAV